MILVHKERILALSLAAAFLTGLAVGGGVGLGTVQRQASAASQPPSGAELQQDSPRLAAPPAGPAYMAEVLAVVDGDTFEARVSIWPGHDVKTKVRLRGIDAPEMRARCEAEWRAALAAHQALATLLSAGQVSVREVGLDKYGGRVLASAAARGTPDVSAALLSRGLVRAYSGGRRESWCPA